MGIVLDYLLDLCQNIHIVIIKIIAQNTCKKLCALRSHLQNVTRIEPDFVVKVEVVIRELFGDEAVDDALFVSFKQADVFHDRLGKRRGVFCLCDQV